MHEPTLPPGSRANTPSGTTAWPCGWLVDKFGVSWQIVPAVLPRLFAEKDREKAGRAVQAMMGMQKLDIAALQKAFDGRSDRPRKRGDRPEDAALAAPCGVRPGGVALTVGARDRRTQMPEGRTARARTDETAPARGVTRGYWVRRMAQGGRVLAPGRRDRTVRFIDARDLADWIVRSIERG